LKKGREKFSLGGIQDRALIFPPWHPHRGLLRHDPREGETRDYAAPGHDEHGSPDRNVCRTTGRDVIASAPLLQTVPLLPPGVRAESLGPIGLSGKENVIELFACIPRLGRLVSRAGLSSPPDKDHGCRITTKKRGAW